jgi:hypothetical protein
MSFNKIVKEYEDKGYLKRGIEKTNLAKEWYGAKKKEGLFNFGFEGVYIYHVEGNVKPVHMNGFLKEYQRLNKVTKNDNIAILRYSGNLKKKEFLTLANKILDSKEYEGLQIQKTGKDKPKRKRLAKRQKP